MKGEDMSTEANKAIVRRLVEEVWGKVCLAVADEIIAPDYVGHASGSNNLSGIDGVKQLAVQVRDSSPEARPQIYDMIAEGDKVVIRWGAGGVPEPWAGITVFRIADGKIVEDWGIVGKPWS
jgi:predicted SnoaL-like aldol condensation-catalyzing enzyme